MSEPLTFTDIRPGATYSLKQLAPVVGLSVTTLWRDIQEGRLTVMQRKPKASIRVQGEDFLAYIEASKKMPEPSLQEEDKPASQQSQVRPFKYVRVKFPS
jgi:hypothetical protein